MSDDNNTRIIEAVKEQLEKDVPNFGSHRWVLNGTDIIEQYSNGGYEQVHKWVCDKIQEEELKRKRYDECSQWVKKLHIPCPNCEYNLSNSLQEEGTSTRTEWYNIYFTPSGRDSEWSDDGDGDFEFDRYFCRECDDDVSSTYIDEWAKAIEDFCKPYREEGKIVQFKIPEDVPECRDDNDNPIEYEKKYPIPQLAGENVYGKIEFPKPSDFIRPELQARQQVVDKMVADFELAKRELLIFESPDRFEELRKEVENLFDVEKQLVRDKLIERGLEPKDINL